MVWLRQTATAALLCVCVGFWLPHGSNMALDFIKTKYLLSIPMSSSVDQELSEQIPTPKP